MTKKKMKGEKIEKEDEKREEEKVEYDKREKKKVRNDDKICIHRSMDRHSYLCG